MAGMVLADKGIDMAIKKSSSIHTQLKEANAALAAAQKELSSAKNTLEYYGTSLREARNELTQIHSFLDAVPNAPASKAADGYTLVSAMTRLSVWLATRGQVA